MIALLTVSPKQLKSDTICSSVLAFSVTVSTLAEIGLAILKVNHSPMNLASSNAA
jgi:hypothetical protein